MAELTFEERRANSLAIRQRKVLDSLNLPAGPVEVPFVGQTLVDGEPSFRDQPDRGFFATVGNRLQRGGLRQDDGISSVFTRSIAQQIARWAPEDLASPIPRTDKGKIVYPDGSVSNQSAGLLSGSDFYNALPDYWKLFYESKGRGEAFFSEYSSFDDAEKAFQFHRLMIENDDSISSQGGFTKVGSGTLAFVADIVTDPLTVVTLGTVGATVKGAKIAGSQLVKSSSRATFQKTFGRAGTKATISGLNSIKQSNGLFIFPSIRAGRSIGVYGLMAAEGGALGLATAKLVDDSQNEVLEKYYDQTEEYNTNWGMVGLSGLASAGMTAGLAKLLGGRQIASNAASRRMRQAHAFTGYDTPTLRRTQPLASQSPVFNNVQDSLRIDVNATDLDDRVRETTHLLMQSRGEDLPWMRDADWFAKKEAKGFTNKKREDLLDFLLKFPTKKELEKWAKAPKTADVPETTWEKTIADLKDLNGQLRELRSVPRDAQDDAEIKRVVDKIRRRKRKLDNLLDNEFHNPSAVLQRAEAEGRLDVETQATVLTEALKEAGDLPNESIRSFTYLNRALNYVAPVATGFTGRDSVKKLDDPVLNFFAQFVDHFEHTSDSFNPTRDFVLSLGGRYRHETAKMQRALKPYMSYMTDHAGNANAQTQFQKDVLRELANGPSARSNDRVSDAARSIRAYLDDVGARGVELGVYKQRQNNFVPIRINANRLSNDGLVTTLIDDLVSRYRGVYGIEEDSVLHIGTLKELGILVRDENGLRYASNVIEGTENPIPRRFSDLSPENQARYRENWRAEEGAIVKEAQNSIGRRFYQDTRDIANPRWGDPDISDVGRLRDIDQEFWLSDRMIDNEYVDIDVQRVLNSYLHHSADLVAQQQAVNELTGSTSFTWDGIIRFLERRAKNIPDRDVSKQAQDVVQVIKRKEQALRGALPRDDVGEDGAAQYIMEGLGKATAQSMIGPSLGMLTLTETAQALLDSIWGKGSQSRIMREILQTVMDADNSRELAADIGHAFEYQRAQTRYLFNEDGGTGTYAYTWGDRLRRPFENFRQIRAGNQYARNSAYGSRGGVRQQVLGAFEGLADLSGELTIPEAAVTMRSRNMVAISNYRRLNDNWEKLVNLARLLEENTTEGMTDRQIIRQFRGLAREAGFGNDWKQAWKAANAGLLDPEMIMIGNVLRSKDSEALYLPENILSNAATLPSQELRRMATEFEARALDMVNREVDTIITRTRVWDQATGHRNSLNRVYQTFMSFPRAFFGNRMTDLAFQGTASSVFHLGLFLMMESVIYNMRAIVYGGHSPDTLMQRWEEDPVGMSAFTMSRIPWLGPWTSVGTALGSRLLGIESAPADPRGMAGFYSLTQSLAGMGSALNAVVNDEKEITPGNVRTFSRTLPVLNYVPVRIAERLSEGFNPDEDR